MILLFRVHFEMTYYVLKLRSGGEIYPSNEEDIIGASRGVIYASISCSYNVLARERNCFVVGERSLQLPVAISQGFSFFIFIFIFKIFHFSFSFSFMHLFNNIVLYEASHVANSI